MKLRRFLQIKKLNLGKTIIFTNTFKFIDDFCTLINDEFENDFVDIYADDLELNNENEDSCKASLLGTSICCMIENLPLNCLLPFLFISIVA